MHTVGQKANCTTEKEFEEFNRRFDFDVFCLEVEHNERLGNALLRSVKKRLKKKQNGFNRMLRNHAETKAENEGKKQQFYSELQHLASKWNATLITERG